MKNPAGVECPWFYGDYYRGRETERCDLLGSDWQPSLCATCPVPGIHQANACSHLRLRPHVRRDWRRGFRRTVVVDAWCEKSAQKVARPHVGCGQCHDLPSIFYVSDDDSDASA